MIIIAHRGNTSGIDEKNENKPATIQKALDMGFHVEIDLWVVDSELYLGHDKPQYKVELEFLQNSKLWIHCKNKEALERMQHSTDVHYFWHQTDTYTLTSKGYVWTYVGADLTDNSVCVLPKNDQDVRKCYAICTDDPVGWVKKLSRK